MPSRVSLKMEGEAKEILKTGAPNEDIVQNHLT